MSTVEERQQNPLTRYTGGEDRFVKFAEEILGLNLLDVQKEILRAVQTKRRVCIVSGNGVGKTYTVAALEIAFLYTHYNATVLHTSRSNGHTRNTTYKELREMLSEAQEKFDLPGYAKKQPMEIDFEDRETRKYEAVSPSNPDGLEGRHNEHFLAVVDEADKKEIDLDVIESAESSLTDDNDRMVVIGNPPRNKGNSVYELMESDHWETIRFSSFDCDNVQVALGQKDGEIIPGPIQLSEIKYDWETKVGEDWSSYEDVMEVSAPYVDDDGNHKLFDDGGLEENSEFRKDLPEYWYRRRLGIIPPTNATRPRPFYSSDVAEATERWEHIEDSDAPLSVDEYDALGVDVAGRGVDTTVVTGVTRASQESVGRADVLAEIDGDTETEIENGIRHAIKDAEDTPIGFDTVGMGGPVADTFRNEGFNVVRFDGSKKAKDDSQYRNQRTESWDEFGDWLYNGAVKPDTPLSVELFGVAEHIEMEEKSLRAGTVYIATSKDELKKASKYGESPDYLDSASMAVWASNHNRSNDWRSGDDRSWSGVTIR